MTAREYLERIEKIDMQIKYLMLEQKRWAELTIDKATNTASNMSPDKVQSSSDLQKMECALVNGMDKDNEYSKRITELKAEKQKIIDVILSLPPLLSKILYRKYVQAQELKEIAFELKKSYSAIAVAHGRALKKVDMLINE